MFNEGGNWSGNVLTHFLLGICLTSDLDIMFKHMNNARYVRELDFARFHFYERSGIYSKIIGGKGSALQSACTIRYRRPIPLFTTYKVTTKVLAKLWPQFQKLTKN